VPNILIADDHDLVRDTIAAYLGTCADLRVFTAGTLENAFEVMAAGDHMDLVILDYEMPGMNGLDGLREIGMRFPALKTAIISGVATHDIATRAMEHGAVAFFPKSISAETMIQAVSRVLSGEMYMPVSPPSVSSDRHGLSARELEVLGLLYLGHSNKSIARELGIKPVTASFHVQKIMAKLDVSNRTQAAMRAKELNLV
jgi:two-component system nitrate/nitrite response regulator NarL